MQTFKINQATVEAAITPRTRAIVVVRPSADGGGAAVRAGRSRNLVVIEDGAQAIGARRKIGADWRLAGELRVVRNVLLLPEQLWAGTATAD